MPFASLQVPAMPCDQFWPIELRGSGVCPGQAAAVRGRFPSLYPPAAVTREAFQMVWRQADLLSAWVPESVCAAELPADQLGHNSTSKK